ncbi:restriction endonuclease subunit S [Paraburkholderia sp. XV]|uniref:restriction endonuclease subunit S n=1 Tax=Paraburkholderia sp. XV TaxID=2831520 RepID=UPI001CD5EAED|nr:restriction endonuclease subunit S [Paraburkholderia sp. XV]
MSTFDELTFAPVYVVDVKGRQAGLFRAHKGKRLIAAHRKPGTTPFVGASRVNNSITDFADTPVLFPGGWVTLIYNGDGGTGHAKYQPAPFSASDDVIALEPLSDLATEPALLLIASMLTQQCVPKFGFGYKLTLHRLGRQKIMAPVTSNVDGEQVVDWEGMTRLGEELLRIAKERVIEARRSSTDDDDTSQDLTFEPMLVTDVFDSMKASSAWYDKSKLALTGEGQYPFVSRTRENNGIDGACVRQEKSPEPGNAVTIGLDTQTVAYQPVAFYTSQNIQVLRHERLSVDSALVLSALIKQQMSRFSWGGNGATLGRLRKTRIMVPVTTDAGGEKVVDWEGMSRYGRALRVRAERTMDVIVDAAAEPISPSPRRDQFKTPVKQLAVFGGDE